MEESKLIKYFTCDISDRTEYEILDHNNTNKYCKFVKTRDEFKITLEFSLTHEEVQKFMSEKLILNFHKKD